MPEVAVDEDGDARPWENDVRPAGEFLYMLAKPQTPLVEFRPHESFQARIPSLDTGHAIAALPRREVVGH
jgi:hypothetical protein